jgi:transposase-like protein
LADEQHKDLTPKQIQAVGLLMSGASMENVAEAVTINRTTLYRWRKLPAFKAALRDAGDELWQDTTAVLKGMTEEALAAISAYFVEADDGSLEKAYFALRYVRDINRVHAANEAINEERKLNDALINAEQGAAGLNGNGHRHLINWWEED